jgi:chromosome segregation ATPase
MSERVHASILAGPEVSLVGISRQELIIESDVRLAPGAGICLNVTIADANYLAGGRITKVDAALSAGRVKYRAGVKLDNEVPAFDLESAEPVKLCAEEVPPPEAPPNTAEDPMDQQQTLQMLKTALRSSEAHRKQLTEEYTAARATWDAERRALDARIAQAEKTATAAGQQVHTSREAERLLAGKHAQEQAAWTKERAALQEKAKQIEARAAQGDARANQLDARVQQAEAQAKAFEARVNELEPRLKQLEPRLKELEPRLRELEPRVKELEPKVKDLEARLAQSDAAAKKSAGRIDELQKESAATQERERAALARVKELETSARSAQEAMKKRELRVEELGRDLTAARENEQRLSRSLEEQKKRLDAMLRDKEKQDAELDAALATVTAAEQRIGTHEKERRDWTAQKERLTARLQTTEKWCADQQQLLYELQQQLGRATTLLDGWKPQLDSVETAARKATA